jgi:outer membrane protein assembly factor BamB
MTRLLAHGAGIHVDFHAYGHFDDLWGFPGHWFASSQGSGLLVARLSSEKSAETRASASATSWGPKYVYAIDAVTGARKWTYEPDIPDDVLQYACSDVNNRGVAFADGKLFVGRLDGKLSALDAATGKELWTSTVVDYKQGSVITSPPLVVRDKASRFWRRRIWRTRRAAGVRHE